MSDSRRAIPQLLLALLTVVGIGGAVIGVVLAPKNASLGTAVSNTLDSSGYSEVVTETLPTGTQTDHLTYEAPNRLGGYIQSGDRRTYVVVIGSSEYQSITVAATAGAKHLVFYKQTGQPVSELDPAHNYLRYASEGKDVIKDGSTYTFVLTQKSQTGTFVYTVSGSYISAFGLTVKKSSVDLALSQVGSPPPVRLPAGSKVIASSATGSASAG